MDMSRRIEAELVLEHIKEQARRPWVTLSHNGDAEVTLAPSALVDERGEGVVVRRADGRVRAVVRPDGGVDVQGADMSVWVPTDTAEQDLSQGLLSELQRIRRGQVVVESAGGSPVRVGRLGNIEVGGPCPELKTSTVRVSSDGQRISAPGLTAESDGILRSGNIERDRTGSVRVSNGPGCPDVVVLPDGTVIFDGQEAFVVKPGAGKEAPSVHTAGSMPQFENYKGTQAVRLGKQHPPLELGSVVEALSARPSWFSGAHRRIEAVRIISELPVGPQAQYRRWTYARDVELPQEEGCLLFEGVPAVKPAAGSLSLDDDFDPYAVGQEPLSGEEFGEEFGFSDEQEGEVRLADERPFGDFDFDDEDLPSGEFDA